MALNGTIATQISSVWLGVISNPETIEESEFERAFLGEDCSEITTPIFVAEIHEKLALSSPKATVFLLFKRTITTGVIKEQNIRREMPMFITYSLSSDKFISSSCVESIRNLINVGMIIPSTPSETAKVIDTVLPFFNELALRLAFNLNNEMKVV